MNNGWQTKSLGELCRFIDYRGKTPEKTEGGLRLITAKNVKMGFLQTDPLEYVNPDSYESWMTRGIPRMGDVLFTTEAPLANVAQLDTDERVVFAQRIIVLQPFESHLDRTFLKYLLLSDSAQQRIQEKGTGATVKGIKASLLKTVEIGYPPLPEQRRIVAILDEAFAAIDTAKANTQQNLKNARALFDSQLHLIFSKPKQGWELKQLSSLCHEITVGHVGSMIKEYRDSGVTFLRSQNIRPFEISLENVVYIDDAFHRTLKKSKLTPGDLAIVRTGYPGTAAVIPLSLSEANCSDLVIVRPADRVNPHFLAAFFNSSFGKQLVIGRIVGAAQKHFNVTAAKETMLYLPPMSEQQQIVKLVDSLRTETRLLESVYQQKLDALDALKKSLLHDAFRGKLTNHNKQLTTVS